MLQMKDDYIIRITYSSGSVWFKGQTGTLRLYPGVKGYATLKNANKATEKIKGLGRYIKRVEVIKRSFEVLPETSDKLEFPHGEFDNGKHLKDDE